MNPSQKVRHVDFYHDEWLAGTMALTAVERGIYITACALIYSHGGPVLKEEVRRLSGCHGNAYRHGIERLLSFGKISENGLHFDVKRCENELEKARNRHGKAFKNGLNGGRPSQQINGIEKPAGFVGEKLRARSSNHQPPTRSTPLPPKGGLWSIPLSK